MNELEELKIRVDGLSAIIDQLAITISNSLRVDINPVMEMQRAIEYKVGALYLKDIVKAVSSNSLGLIETPNSYLTSDDVHAFVSYFEKHDWVIERSSALRGRLINIPYEIGCGLKFGIDTHGHIGIHVFKFAGNHIEHVTPLSDLDVPRGVLLNSFRHGLVVGKHTDEQRVLLEPLEHITSANMFYTVCERLLEGSEAPARFSGCGKEFMLSEGANSGEISLSEIPNPHNFGSHKSYTINNSNLDALNAIPIRMRLSVYDTYSWYLKGLEEEKRELEKGKDNVESQSNEGDDQ